MFPLPHCRWVAELACGVLSCLQSLPSFHCDTLCLRVSSPWKATSMFLIARGCSRPQLNTHARDALTCQVWARHMTKKGSGPPEGPSFPQGTKWYSIKKKKKGCLLLHWPDRSAGFWNPRLGSTAASAVRSVKNPSAWLYRRSRSSIVSHSV